MLNDHENMNSPVVGIVGGICSGKTTVAAVFEKNGFYRIDADRIAHSLLATEEIGEKLRKFFGKDIFNNDGSVDRPRLADIAFEDVEKLSELNSIIHPQVIDVIDQRLLRAGGPVVLDAALLVETGLDEKFCTDVVFVEKPLAERVELAREQRGWGREELIRREAAQQPVEKKKQKADLVLYNNGSLIELKQKVMKVIRNLLG